MDAWMYEGPFCILQAQMSLLCTLRDQLEQKHFGKISRRRCQIGINNRLHKLLKCCNLHSRPVVGDVIFLRNMTGIRTNYLSEPFFKNKRYWGITNENQFHCSLRKVKTSENGYFHSRLNTDKHLCHSMWLIQTMPTSKLLQIMLGTISHIFQIPHFSWPNTQIWDIVHIYFLISWPFQTIPSLKLCSH